LAALVAVHAGALLLWGIHAKQAEYLKRFDEARALMSHNDLAEAQRILMTCWEQAPSIRKPFPLVADLPTQGQVELSLGVLTQAATHSPAANDAIPEATEWFHRAWRHGTDAAHEPYRELMLTHNRAREWLVELTRSTEFSAFNQVPPSAEPGPAGMEERRRYRERAVWLNDVIAAEIFLDDDRATRTYLLELQRELPAYLDRHDPHRPQGLSAPQARTLSRLAMTEVLLNQTTDASAHCATVLTALPKDSSLSKPCQLLMQACVNPYPQPPPRGVNSSAASGAARSHWIDLQKAAVEDQRLYDRVEHSSRCRFWP